MNPQAGVTATRPLITPEQKPLTDINRDLCLIILVIVQLKPPTQADKFVVITAFTALEFIEYSLPP
jgi:hypothetical protein